MSQSKYASAFEMSAGNAVLPFGEIQFHIYFTNKATYTIK